ncbi:MAG TPA: hypothetical protein VI942_11920 [Thermoanaerobaculia bacterium]|nr:hypothetical protein [Thermoanaerobaculia bacterium]
MLEAVARQLTHLRVPVDRLVGTGAVAAFFWLLLQDRIHPAVVYALELYLTL